MKWATCFENIAVNAPLQPILPIFCTWDSPVELILIFKIFSSIGKSHNKLRHNPPPLENNLDWNWIVFLNNLIFLNTQRCRHTQWKSGEMFVYLTNYFNSKILFCTVKWCQSSHFFFFSLKYTSYSDSIWTHNLDCNFSRNTKLSNNLWNCFYFYMYVLRTIV